MPPAYRQTTAAVHRLQWLKAGYHTLPCPRALQFEGHQDYIRYMEVHPSQPYVLTCSDDMQVREARTQHTGPARSKL